MYFCLSLAEKGRFFRFRMPSLNLLGASKQSLPQEDPDTVMVDSPRTSDDSVPLRDFPSPTKDSCSPADVNDTRALISSSPHSSPVSVSGPLDHSSPKQLWDRPSLSQAQSITCLAQSLSKDSVYSRRRASSVHDIEGLSNNTKRLLRDRHASEGNCRHLKETLTRCLNNLSKLIRSSLNTDIWDMNRWKQKHMELFLKGLLQST